MQRHIIILANGRQSRLPHLDMPKHLLVLPTCQETILARTVRILGELLDPGRTRVTIVGREPHKNALLRLTSGFDHRDNGWTRYDGPPRCEMPSGWLLTVVVLARQHTCVLSTLDDLHAMEQPPGRTVLLLGDVVYSRNTLSQIVYETRPVSFAGTPDLTDTRGELFGASWAPELDNAMRGTLHRTPRTPLRVAHAGQLRRLLWRWQEEACERRGIDTFPPVLHRVIRTLGHYQEICDWTSDIDTLDDVAHKLPRLDQFALAEEREELRLRELRSPEDVTG